MEYREIKEQVEVPRNAGIEGFLSTVKEVLRKPRVQELTIDARGVVSFRYFLRAEEKHSPLKVDFETLQPYSVIRNSKVSELVDPHTNAAIAVAQLLAMAADDHVFPAAWVSGPQSNFWEWYQKTTGIPLKKSEDFYGVPFLEDRMLDDSVLVLCAAYGRAASLIDTQRSYKLLIP